MNNKVSTTIFINVGPIGRMQFSPQTIKAEAVIKASQRIKYLGPDVEALAFDLNTILLMLQLNTPEQILARTVDTIM